jgi:hypothetical protein
MNFAFASDTVLSTSYCHIAKPNACPGLQYLFQVNSPTDTRQNSLSITHPTIQTVVSNNPDFFVSQHRGLPIPKRQTLFMEMPHTAYVTQKRILRHKAGQHTLHYGTHTHWYKHKAAIGCCCM